MKRKTTRKEVIEEFDENGVLKSRTTINETEEEDDNCKTSAISEDYYDATKATSGYVAHDRINGYGSGELVGQISLADRVMG